MSDDRYRVRLDAYYGPMDLLLHLVQVNEVDIVQLPIARIADQYVEYLKTLEKHDLDVSGDFVAMASTLLLLKSRALVPPPPDEESVEEDPPLLDLIRKLLEFRRVKDMAARVGALIDARADRWERPRLRPKAEPAGPADAADVDLFDLVVAYAKLVDRTTLRGSLQILYRDLPIESFIQKILAAIARGGRTMLSEIVGDWGDRGAVIGSFLAMLELAKQQKVAIDQPEPGADIAIRAPESPGEAADPVA